MEISSRKYGITFFPLLLLSLLFFACKKETETVLPPGNSYLVESSLITEITKDDLTSLLSNSQVIGSLIPLVSLEGIKVYKIVYKTTDTAGETINVSGALAFPSDGGTLPLISYQHGTITKDAEAPSNFQQGTEFQLFGSFMAGRGYAVAAPDYIGYGTSANVPHPYEHGATLGRTSADMIMAVKEFFEEQGASSLNNKLLLTGYSEGGYATMSTHHYLESYTDLEVTVSAPGAGAYHKIAFSNYILSQDTSLDFLATYLWVVNTYNRVYGLNRPLDYYIQEPYASLLKDVDPKEYRNHTFDKNPQNLFTSEAIQGVLEEMDTAFLNAIADNDRYDWQPKAPIKLYHGTADDYVPFFNAQDAFDAMKAKGADVELIPIQGKDHFTASPDFLLLVYQLFESRKN